MAIKETTYSKTFTSETGYEPGGNHNHPPERYYQKINKEEQKLREEVVNMFGLEGKFNEGYFSSESKAEGKGFDGTFQYIFYFRTKNLKTKNENPKENVEYESIACIRKAGDSRPINHKQTASDIENFLLSNGFTEVRD